MRRSAETGATAARCDVRVERLPALDVLEEQVHDAYDRSRVRAAGMILRLADLRKTVPPGKEED